MKKEKKQVLEDFSISKANNIRAMELRKRRRRRERLKRLLRMKYE